MEVSALRLPQALRIFYLAGGKALYIVVLAVSSGRSYDLAARWIARNPYPNFALDKYSGRPPVGAPSAFGLFGSEPPATSAASAPNQPALIILCFTIKCKITRDLERILDLPTGAKDKGVVWSNSDEGVVKSVLLDLKIQEAAIDNAAPNYHLHWIGAK